MKKNTSALCLAVAGLCVVFTLSSCEQQEGPSQTAKPAPAPAVSGDNDGFSGTLPTALAGLTMSASAGGVCVVDLINDSASEAVTVSKNSPLKMIGWAVDGKTISVPRTVVIQLASVAGGKFYAPAARTKRPGLATAFKTPAYEDGGFDTGSVSLSNVPAGQYAVSVIQVSDEASPDTALVCDAQKKMEIE